MELISAHKASSCLKKVFKIQNHFLNGYVLLGIFETIKASKGTFAIAEAIANNLGAISIIDGGESVKAINKRGQGDDATFVSTDSGASLALLEGKLALGIDAVDQYL